MTGGQGAEPVGGGAGDGLRDRVFGGVLHRAGERSSSTSSMPSAGCTPSRVMRAGGDGAGLVEHDGVDPAGGLQHLGPFDQDAELGAAAGADQQRGRGGQAERAGAGDDQHGDGGGERRLTAGTRRRARPPRVATAMRDHDGHEDAGDPVGEPLHLGLAGLGVLDQPGHLRELGVGADPGGAHHEPAAGVDGRAHRPGRRRRPRPAPTPR